MKYLITAALVFSAAFFSTAQTISSYGQVGKQVITPEFIELLQLINPEFGLTPDAKAFESKLEKYYILQKASADSIRKTKLYSDPTLKRNIELIKALAEEKYLSTVYSKTKDVSFSASDAEARSYYDQHKNDFVTPGSYTYLYASILDTVKYPVSDISKKMKVYADAITDEFKVGNKDEYYIVLFKNHTLYPTDQETKRVAQLKEGEGSLPYKDGDRTALYFLIKKQNSSTQPFEQVKETCRNMMINEKRSMAEEAFRTKMLKDYQILLNSNFFK
jgi:hypothetical protein